MKKYAKVINEETKEVSIAISENPDVPYFESRGFTLQEVEQAYDGSWYVKGYAPEKPVEYMQAEVRAVRNQYLETYVDPKQLVMVWDSLSADDKKLYADYRQYLLDYTKYEGWYLQNPKTLDEWKNTLVPEENEQEVKETNSSDSEEVI